MAPYTYQPTIRKFCGNENSVQWLEDYISEIEAPGGPGPNSKHVYFGECLTGPGYDWYCNVLEYKSKVYWDLLQAAFVARWNTVTHDVCTVEVSPNLKPPDNIRQQLTAYIPPPADCTTNTTLDWAADVNESMGSVPVMSAMVDPAPLTPIIEVGLTNSILATNIIATAALHSTLPVTNSPRDLSSLRSGSQNPWGSLRHRNRRSYSPSVHRTYSRPEPIWYSHLHQPHPKPLQNSPTHSHLTPTHVFQIIQHPRGISPTKPKITKTIPITSRPSAETQKPISITQCLCGRNIPHIYNPNQSWRSGGTKRRFGRRVGTWRESWDCGRGPSHFLGGTQVWGPHFRERGYMDQLRWSGSGFGSGFGGDHR